MSAPRLLDLFCGAGGCARGYQLAGFHVTGVDIKPQPRYIGDIFHQADALEFVAEHGHEYSVIHASPPCQAFTQMSARYRGKGGRADSHPDLLTPTREILKSLGIPYVIENVVGARRHMQATFMLHGGMFGLGVHRPRLFESNILIFVPRARQAHEPIGVYGTKADGRVVWRNSMRADGTYGHRTVIRAAKSIGEAREAMDIDWMTWEEIREAIPPAYTRLIGEQLMSVLTAEAVS